MRVGILCSEKTWLVEQIEYFLKRSGAESEILFLNKLPTDIDVDYIIVRGGPGLKKPEQWGILIRVVKSLEEKGIGCINSSKAIENGINKFSTYLLLKENGIPTPETFLLDDSKIKKFPAVAKPVMGSEGEGVEKIESQEELKKIRYRPILIQDFLPHGGIDYRAYVIGDSVLGGIARRAKSGWVTNLAKGGIPEKYNPSEKEKNIAERSAKAIEAEIATVDFVVLKDKKKIYVLEVNVLPIFSERLAEITGFNLAEEIVKYFLERYR